MLQLKWASSLDKEANSGFLLFCCKKLRFPIEFPLRSEASSRFEAWNSGFLLSCILGVRNPVAFRWETCFLVKYNRRVRPPLYSDIVFRIPLDMLHGNLALSEVDAYSVSFQICQELWGSSQDSVGETTPLEV